MQAGKLPAELLASLLAKAPSRDPRVLLGPGIGRDAAVIDIGGPNLLVAKTDPITFATDQIGRYAVHVNANDIACLGARPAWFLATIFLPEGTEPEAAASIFEQILEACEMLGVELIGGHTEITFGLDRPIVSGAMLGEVHRDRLVRPDGARPGDILVLTKGIAIEGTAVLALEASDRLREMGVSDVALQAAREYLTDPGISVVREATAACETVHVHAMHDPTEGGLATALYEMAHSCGLGIVIEERQVSVYPATQDLCATAKLDPLGVLASGALLIAVSDEDHGDVLGAMADIGVGARRIGKFIKRPGVIMISNGQRKPVPRFQRDEVARFLSQTV